MVAPFYGPGPRGHIGQGHNSPLFHILGQMVGGVLFNPTPYEEEMQNKKFT